jgi:hypothetical protein
MSKYVFRTDLRHQPVGAALACIDASEIVHRPTAPTFEECVHMLVADDEICLGATQTKRSVMQGARVVGYIHIVDADR